MNNMKLLLVYHPFSGKGKISKIEELKKLLDGKYDITEFVSNGVGSITTYIENIKYIYDVIAIAGGDGTVNEAIKAISKLSYSPKIAVIPLGTMNDFSHYLHMSKNIKKTAQYIINANTKKHYIYKANDSIFVYGFALGILSNVSYKNFKHKKLFGRLSYYFLAIKELFKSKKAKLVIYINGEKIKDAFNLVLVSSTSRIAGYNVKESDDLTITLFKGIRILFPFKLLWYFITGHTKYKYNAKEFEIHSNLKDFNTDGEHNDTGRRIKVEKYKEFEFIKK